jgi:hypothetical protein
LDARKTFAALDAYKYDQAQVNAYATVHPPTIVSNTPPSHYARSFLNNLQSIVTIQAQALIAQ